MAQLCFWTKIRKKQWLVLGVSAFQCMHAGFLCSKCDNFACLHTRQAHNELHLWCLASLLWAGHKFNCGITDLRFKALISNLRNLRNLKIKVIFVQFVWTSKLVVRKRCEKMFVTASWTSIYECYRVILVNITIGKKMPVCLNNIHNWLL